MGLIIGLPVLLLTALFITAAFPARGHIANWLVIAAIIYGEIVLIAETLSILRVIGLPGYLLAEVLLLIGAWWVWRRRGQPPLLKHVRVSFHELKTGFQHHRLLAVFALVVGLLCLTNLILATIYPTEQNDDLAYHLPRAYFWIQNGTAQHYDALDTRQIEFPPNTSFVYMWWMLHSGGYTGLHTAEWISGLMTALAVAGLARVAGFKPAQAIFVALVYLTTTNTVLQMGARYNDLITAMPTVSFIFFAFRFLEKPSSRPELICAGLSFGLALGSKYTVLFMLPPAAVVLTIYAVYRLRRQALHALIGLGVSSVLGFGLFGSYNYILNFVNYGNPITSQDIDDSSALLTEENRVSFYGPARNVLRYVFQMPDMGFLASSAQNPIFHLNAHQQLDSAFGLQAEFAEGFSFGTIGRQTPHVGISGYGLTAYLAIITSPLVLLWYLARRKLALHHVAAALLIAIGLGWLITFAWIAPWSPYKQRYFHVFIPLILAAGALPWLYSRRRLAAVWLIPVMILSVSNAVWALGPYQYPALLRRSLAGEFDALEYARMNPVEVGWLRTALAAGSTIGLTGSDNWSFAFMNHLPEYRYTYIQPAQINEALADERVQAVLGSNSACPHIMDRTYYLPSSIFAKTGCLFMLNPRAYLQNAGVMDYFGVQVIQTPVDHFITIRENSLLVSYQEGRFEVSLPTWLIADFAGNLRIETTNDQGGILVERALCNNQNVATAIRDDGLDILFPQTALAPDQPFQHCRLEMASGYTRFNNEMTRVMPVQMPAPDTDVDLYLGSEFSLLATHLAAYEVRQCDSLYVGSWWKINESPDTDYRITAVLTDSSGVGQTRHDGLLAGLPAADLEIGQTVIDRRFIPIPCDLPAGRYDVLMGLYNPVTLENLPITLPDGAPQGTLAYITSVNIIGQ